MPSRDSELISFSIQLFIHSRKLNIEDYLEKMGNGKSGRKSASQEPDNRIPGIHQIIRFSHMQKSFCDCSLRSDHLPKPEWDIRQDGRGSNQDTIEESLNRKCE